MLNSGRQELNSSYSKTRDETYKGKNSLWKQNTTKSRLTEVSGKMLSHGYKGVRPQENVEHHFSK